MPVQGKPQNRPPYWQMPPQKKTQQVSKPMTKREYCAICELKQLVDKIGQNLCSPICKACNQDGKGCIRPVSAMPNMQYVPCGGDCPMLATQTPRMPQPEVTMFQPYHPPPIPTYTWPQYNTGLQWPPHPQQQNEDFCYDARQHPYLPVQIDIPTEEKRKQRHVGRARTANYGIKKVAELRGSLMLGCDCTKKNGLQDHCPKLICQEMPRVGTWENPSEMPCRIAPCKSESVSEDDDQDECIKGNVKEVPVRDVPQKPKSPKTCKPSCEAACKHRKK